MIRRTPIRRVSSVRAVAMKLYAAARLPFLAARPKCERCQKKKAMEVHHKAGRTGKNFLDQSTWMAACPECHRWIHEHPGQARAAGFLK